VQEKRSLTFHRQTESFIDWWSKFLGRIGAADFLYRRHLQTLATNKVEDGSHSYQIAVKSELLQQVTGVLLKTRAEEAKGQQTAANKFFVNAESMSKFTANDVMISIN